MKLFFRTFLFLFYTSFYAQIPNYVPLNGLTGYWPFTGNANDHSPNVNHGSVIGAQLTTDRFGSATNAYYFNGNGNYISTNYNGILGTNARAVAFWAKTSSSKIMTGISWGDNGTAARYEAGFNYGAPGPLLDGGNGVITYSPNTPVNDNAWHHYVMQMGQGSTLGQVEIYQDAVLLTKTSNVYSGGNLLNTLAGSKVLFGTIGFSPYNYFVGSLDDIGIWNRKLTQCEINSLYLGTGFNISVVTSNSNCTTSATLTPAGIQGPFSYTWLPTGGNAAVISGASSGTYTYIVSSANSCMATGTLNFSASAVLNISASSPTACIGNSVTLVANTGGSGFTYHWINGPATASNSIGSSLPGVFTYTAVASGSNGCSATKTVSVQYFGGALSIMGYTAMCKGSTTTLSVTGASTYSWSNGATGSVVTLPSIASIYTVTGGGSQCPSKGTVTISVLDTLKLNVTGRKELCEGEGTWLTATGAQTYTWSSVVVSDKIYLFPSSSITVALAGSVAGCTTTTLVELKLMECTSVETILLSEKNIFPNPFSEEIRISNIVPGSVIRIFDASGNLVFTDAVPQEDFLLFTGHLPSGIYLVRIDNASASLKKKIVKL